jgi:hypothetical protein
MNETFTIALGTIVFCAVEFILHRKIFKNNFDIVAFSHALFEAIASSYVVLFTFERPSLYILHVLQGGKPGMIENMLPMVTWGYSIWDIGNGIYTGDKSFLYHGIVLFVLCGSLYYFSCLHLLTGPLLMEVSTVFLNLIDLNVFALKMAFLLSFLIIRWAIIPYLWMYYIIQSFYYQIGSVRKENDSPLPVDWVVLIGGIAFHGLNVYWGIKILRKAQREFKRKD